MAGGSYVHKIQLSLQHGVPKFMLLYVQSPNRNTPRPYCDLTLYAVADEQVYLAELQHPKRATYRHAQFRGEDDQLVDVLLKALARNPDQQQDPDTSINAKDFGNRLRLIVNTLKGEGGLCQPVAIVQLYQTELKVSVHEWALQACIERDRALEAMRDKPDMEHHRIQAQVEAQKMAQSAVDELQRKLNDLTQERSRDREEVDAARKDAVQAREELLQMKRDLVEAQNATQELQMTADDLRSSLTEQTKISETLAIRLQKIKQVQQEKQHLASLETAVSASKQKLRHLMEEIEKNGDGQKQLIVEAGPPTLLLEDSSEQATAQLGSSTPEHLNKNRKINEEYEESTAVQLYSKIGGMCILPRCG